MNKIITLVALVALTSCIENKHFVDDASLKGANGSSCTTKQMANGALIECTDGSISVIINGADGTAGLNGTNGVDGVNGTNGSNGTNGVDGVNGTNGTNGMDGTNGLNGTNGVNGTNGSNGQNASGIYIIEVINPCGAEFASEEVFLRLSNGTILALYDGGPNLDRLSLLTPGSYVTTDSNSNHSCSFTVNSSMQVINQVRH